MPTQTKYLDLADTLIRRISTEMRPGDPFLTVRELARQYGVGKQTASRVVQLLKERGAISGKPGGKTWVRIPPRQTQRSNERYLEEKALLHEPEEVRRATGTSERDQGVSLQELAEDSASHEEVPCPKDVAAVMGLAPGTRVLRRTRVRRHDSRAGAGGSVSYVPADVVALNPEVFSEAADPWPGGMQHQLYTVGIKLAKIVDHVVASMPSEEESEMYDVPPGIPMFHIRKTSYSTTGRVVEVADIPLTSDNTTLIYVTNLTERNS